MTPILFPATSTEWKTQGLGALSDAVSCTVTEERNGIFELEMQYPMSGVHFDEMQNRCIILAIPSPYRAAQPFRIYRITKPLNGICTVYAQHISYDLSGVPLNPFTAGSAPAAMAGLQSNAEGGSPFTFWTDKSTAANFAVNVPSATRSVLGGQTGSILDVYGGEYAWDGYTVRLYNQRGQDNGVRIAYGKNLTDLEQDENISNVATGIYPYWADTDGNLVVCDPKIVPAPGTYDFTRVVPVDFSQDFEEQPTQEQLQARAESYVQANNIGVPTVSIAVSFVQLEQTEEYKDLALLEKCDLCDTVTVQFERLGVDAKAEIVKIVTDVLLERYKSVEIGSIRANIADTIAGQQQDIQQRPTTSAMQQAVTNATNWITGTNGGHVVFQRNAEGQPYEILIMDQPTIEAAVKVWRWNSGGLGYSSSGYNGPYTTAITQDGAIVADFITAGVLNAAIITAGILQSANGKTSINLDTGEAKINGTLQAGDSSFYCKIESNGNLNFYINGQVVGGIAQLNTSAGSSLRATLDSIYLGGGNTLTLFVSQAPDADQYDTWLNIRTIALTNADGSSVSALYAQNGTRILQIDQINGKSVSWTYDDTIGKYVLTGT